MGATSSGVRKTGSNNMAKAKNIGLGIEGPTQACEDPNCPYHGSLKVRGRVFRGEVTSDRMQHSVTISWERRIRLPKYERYMRKRSKLHAHNPPCIDAKEGDVVRVIECRPLSKTKSFVVVEKIGHKEHVVQEEVSKTMEKEAEHREKKKEAKEEEEPSEEAEEEQ